MGKKLQQIGKLQIFGKKKYKLYSNIKITITKANKTKFKTTYITYRTKYRSYNKSTYHDDGYNLSLKSYYKKYYRINFMSL